MKKNDEKKKLIKITLIYLIIGNILFPFIGYIITGNIKGAYKYYAYSFIFSIIFWFYLGNQILNLKELYLVIKN